MPGGRYIGQPLEERIEELEKKFDQEIEIRRSRWQFLKSTVNSALLPYLVPINKRLGYNPKTDKYERIEELEKEVENKYNQLLWIKMIPYREWFWNLKNTTDKQITSLKEVLREIKDQLLYHKLLPNNFDDVYKLDGKDGETSVDFVQAREDKSIDNRSYTETDSRPSIHYAKDCNTIDCRICNPKEPTDKEEDDEVK